MRSPAAFADSPSSGICGSAAFLRGTRLARTGSLHVDRESPTTQSVFRAGGTADPAKNRPHDLCAGIVQRFFTIFSRLFADL
jgi:hypothetical protein